MAGRNRTFDEKAVIAKAIEVFWTHGYEAAATELLQEAMGLGKGSFYNTYKGGKQEVFEKALQQFNEEGEARFIQMLEAAPNKVAFLKSFFLNMTQASKPVHMKGCFMGNTVAELAFTAPALKAKAVKALKDLEGLFARALQAAKDAGEISAKADVPVLALHLIHTWNGVNITRRMYPEQEKLETLINLQLQVLERA